MRQWVNLAKVQTLIQELGRGKENTQTSETTFGNLFVVVYSLLVQTLQGQQDSGGRTPKALFPICVRHLGLMQKPNPEKAPVK